MSHRRRRLIDLPLFALSLAPLALASAVQAAPALPHGGKVVAGQATIGAPTSGGITVDQTSAKAIIDWTSFSLGKGATVTFDNGKGATLNRVTGQNVSSLKGLLTGTGAVYLLNPNGVIIGKSGVVRVGGTFVASTLDIADSAFLAGGPLNFAGPSTATVVNFGRVGSLGGDVAMMAQTVVNHGDLAAGRGTVGLLAGSSVVMRDQGLDDGKFAVLVGGGSTSVANGGAVRAADVELKAEQGNVYALAGNTAGVIRATGTKTDGGRVWLIADGGTLDVAGAISTRSGPNSAGAVETSGEQVRLGAARLDTHGGRWTLDPVDLEITKAGAQTISQSLASGDVVQQTQNVPGSGAGDITLDADASIAWASTHTLTLDAYHSINLNGSITTSGGGGLVLVTNDGGAGGALNIAFNGGVSFTGVANGQPTGALTVNGTSYTLVRDLATLASDIAVDNVSAYALATDIDAGGTTYSGVPLSSTEATPFAGTLEGLGHSISNLTVNDAAEVYVGLFGQIGAAGAVRDLGLKNASIQAPFTGSASEIYVGALAGTTAGQLTNVFSTGVVNSDATGAVVDGSGFAADVYVGGLAGQNSGAVEGSYSAASVSGSAYPGAGGNGGNDVYAGGLFGASTSSGQISSAYALGSVAQGSGKGGYVGGLVGQNSGSIASSYAAGPVLSNGIVIDAGGLVGSDVNGTYTNAYWDTNTTGQASTSGGGTAVTTASLQAGLPTGFDSTVWGILPGVSFPYLLSQSPTGTRPQVISGTVVTPGAGGLALAPVEAVVNGSTVVGDTTSAADGYYYMLLPQGSLPAGSTVLTYLNGATDLGGQAVYANAVQEGVAAGGNAAGLRLATGQLSIISSVGSLSQLEAGLVSALGAGVDASDVIFSVNSRGGQFALQAGDSLSFYNQGSDFDFNRSLNLGTGTLRFTNFGNVTQSAGRIVTSRLTLSGDEGVYLGQANKITTLGNATVADDFTLVNATNLHQAGHLSALDATLITDHGNIAVNGTVSTEGLHLNAVTGLLREGANGVIDVDMLYATGGAGIDLPNSANDITTVVVDDPGGAGNPDVINTGH